MHDSIAFATHRVQLESCNVESLLSDDQASHRTHSQPPILQLGIDVPMPPSCPYHQRYSSILIASLALYSSIEPGHTLIVAPSIGPVHSQIWLAT